MALPVVINASVTYSSKPIKVGSAIYVFGGNSDTNIIQMFKATNPSSSFSEVDSGNRPAALPINDLGAISDGWLDMILDVNDGSTLHLVLYNNDTTAESLLYMQFDTSTDQWVDVNSDGNNGYVVFQATNPLDHFVTIAQRSDGDLIIAERASQNSNKGQSIMGIYYHRWEDPSPSAWNTGWTTGVQVYDSASKDDNSLSQSTLSIGSQDVAFFSWVQTSDSDFHIKGLANNNTLWTQRTLAGSYWSGSAYPEFDEHSGTTDSVVVEQNGTEYHKVGITDIGTGALGSDTNGWVVEFNHVTTDTAPTITSSSIYSSANGEMLHLTADYTVGNNVVYVLYNSITTGADVFAQQDQGNNTWTDVNSGNNINTTIGSAEHVAAIGVNPELITWTDDSVKIIWVGDDDYDEWVVVAGTAGYQNKVLGVTASNINKVLGVDTSTFAKVLGVS